MRQAMRKNRSRVMAAAIAAAIVLAATGFNAPTVRAEHNESDLLNPDYTLKGKLLAQELLMNPEGSEKLVCDIFETALLLTAGEDRDLFEYAKTEAADLLTAILSEGLDADTGQETLYRLNESASRGAACAALRASAKLLMGEEGLSRLVRETCEGAVRGAEQFTKANPEAVNATELEEAVIAGLREGVNKCGPETGRELALLQRAAFSGINKAIEKPRRERKAEQAISEEEPYREEGIEEKGTETYRKQRAASPSE